MFSNRIAFLFRGKTQSVVISMQSCKRTYINSYKCLHLDSVDILFPYGKKLTGLSFDVGQEKLLMTHD